MRTLVTMVAALLPFFSFAQTWTETFDYNSRGWRLMSDRVCRKEIANGKFILTVFNEGYIVPTATPAFFDINKDFILEATFFQRDGSNENGIGLFWGLADFHTFNEFLIRSNGYYKIGSRGTGKWKRTSLVSPLNQENILRVEKKGEVMSYYLNGQLLTQNKLQSYGFASGFVSYSEMTLEVDNFYFDQDNITILAPGIPSDLMKENLGSGVNSTVDEIVPNISADGRTLYFGRKYHIQNVGGEKDGGDVWVSNWVDGQWQAAKNMGEPINSIHADDLTAVSADNNSIFLTRARVNLRSKFVFSSRSEKGWSLLENLGLSFISKSRYIESSLSANGKVMLVSIKTPRNLFYNAAIDERDIYISHRNKNGKWGPFVNLGPNVNSAGSEDSPFLSPDGRTLYFTTTGRPGFGNSDIFMTKRIGDGWTTWSEPLNLGASINTTGFDAYYTVPASGDYAYMVTTENAIGRTDIVRLKLPDALRPNPVVLLFGKTINAKTHAPVTAEILLDNLGSGMEVARATSDPKTGAFKIVLPPGANYGLHAAAKGFLSVNENLELISIKEYDEVEKDLFLIPIEVGVSLQLNNVFFEKGKPDLRSESFPELDRLAQILIDYPSMHIELSGHTDNVGSPDALQQLSNDRVSAVIDYLVSKGINPRRLTGRGYGSANPVIQNDSEEHRKMNRRVEFKIIKK